MKLENVAYWVCLCVMYLTLIYSWILRRKTKKILKNLNKINDERSKAYVDFIDKMQKDYLNFTNEATRRLNALSKENNKLREQNNMMKERLRNLGIKDFDVM